MVISLLYYNAMLPGSRLRIAVRSARWSGQTVAVQKVSGITEAQVLWHMGSCRRVVVAVDLQTGIVNVFLCRACPFPSYLMVVEAHKTTAGLPNVATDSEHRIQIKSETHP
jgi:hypothetical protein